MGFPGTNPEHPYRGPQFCQCDDCKTSREPPPVTDEMRAKWKAMGLEVTKTPQKTTRESQRNQSLEYKNAW